METLKNMQVLKGAHTWISYCYLPLPGAGIWLLCCHGWVSPLSGTVPGQEWPEGRRRVWADLHSMPQSTYQQCQLLFLCVCMFTTLGLAEWARLTGQWASRTHQFLSLPLLLGDYKYMISSLGFGGKGAFFCFFVLFYSNMGSGDPI